MNPRHSLSSFSDRLLLCPHLSSWSPSTYMFATALFILRHEGHTEHTRCTTMLHKSSPSSPFFLLSSLSYSSPSSYATLRTLPPQDIPQHMPKHMLILFLPLHFSSVRYDTRTVQYLPLHIYHCIFTWKPNDLSTQRTSKTMLETLKWNWLLSPLLERGKTSH